MKRWWSDERIDQSVVGVYYSLVGEWNGELMKERTDGQKNWWINE